MLKTELALVLVMYIHCDCWFKKQKTKTNIEIAILAIRGLKSLRKIQFMSYIYVCYELSHTV